MIRRRTTIAVLAPLALGVFAVAPAGAAPAVSGPSSGGIAVTAAAASASGAAASVKPATHATKREKLKGEVGPGFTITLNKDTVSAGRFKIVVNDLSSTMHNFHFSGPGVDKATTVEFEGKVVWKVKLKEGTYTAVCDPHSETMHTSVEVTA
jgi:hypothetical protein